MNCKYDFTRNDNDFILLYVGTGNKIITEGEYVEINGISKDMSGSYECITSNDISPPDVRTVQVTVNCEFYAYILLFTRLLACIDARSEYPSNM